MRSRCLLHSLKLFIPHFHSRVNPQRGARGVHLTLASAREGVCGASVGFRVTPAEHVHDSFRRTWKTRAISTRFHADDVFIAFSFHAPIVRRLPVRVGALSRSLSLWQHVTEVFPVFLRSAAIIGIKSSDSCAIVYLFTPENAPCWIRVEGLSRKITEIDKNYTFWHNIRRFLGFIQRKKNGPFVNK